jgi:lipoprotein NlpD
MKKSHSILFVLISVLLAACATSNAPAPVVSRTTADMSSAPAAPPGAVEGKGYYRVKKGDTLFRIAVEVGQSYKDLVTWNNLANPNDIKVDQLLRVIPPDNIGGAQVGSVAGNSGVEVKPLAAPAATVGAPATDGGMNKTGPRGDKRPYSDAALAELDKQDASTPSVSPAPAAPPSIKAEAPAPNNSNSHADDEALSWAWPADGKIIGSFAAKKGIDIAGKSGQAVLAAGAGKVMYAGAGIRGYGNLVIVKHNNNLLSAYAHNKLILVKEGEQVGKGQKIAEMGNSDSDVVMLHFEIRQQGKPVDPAKYLPSR